jgi:hypothetical protein
VWYAAEKYEDVAGLSLPPATQPFLDAWKRAEELVQNAPNVPMVCLKSIQEVDKKGVEVAMGAGSIWGVPM